MNQNKMPTQQVDAGRGLWSLCNGKLTVDRNFSRKWVAAPPSSPSKTPHMNATLYHSNSPYGTGTSYGVSSQHSRHHYLPQGHGDAKGAPCSTFSAVYASGYSRKVVECGERNRWGKGTERRQQGLDNGFFARNDFSRRIDGIKSRMAGYIKSGQLDLGSGRKEAETSLG